MVARVSWTLQWKKQFILNLVNKIWEFQHSYLGEAEAPVLWPPDAESQFISKDSDAGKDWRWEEKGTTWDEGVVWHHPLNGRECEPVPGDSEGQGSLARCSPWACRAEHDWTTEQQREWKKAKTKLPWPHWFGNSRTGEICHNEKQICGCLILGLGNAVDCKGHEGRWWSSVSWLWWCFYGYVQLSGLLDLIT